MHIVLLSEVFKKCFKYKQTWNIALLTLFLYMYNLISKLSYFSQEIHICNKIKPDGKTFLIWPVKVFITDHKLADRWKNWKMYVMCHPLALQKLGTKGILKCPITLIGTVKYL